MDFPDVIGYTLGEAEEIISNSGFKIEHVTVTSPPRHKSFEYDSTYRVVRIKKITKKKVELLVCNPNIV